MAKVQGIVRAVANKPFCFIKSPSGDVFCHSTDYPKGQVPAEGDSVECEVEDAGKGPKVKKGTLKVLAKGIMPATPSSTPVQNTQPQVASLPPDFDLNVIFGVERLTDGLFELPLRVSVSKNGVPVNQAHVAVELVVFDSGTNLNPDKQGHTDSDGNADFLIHKWKEADAPLSKPQRFSMQVNVVSGNRTLSRNINWPSIDFAVSAGFSTAGSSKPPLAKFLTAEPLGFDRVHNAYCYRVQTRSGVEAYSPAIAATVIVVSALTLEVGFVNSTAEKFESAVDGEVVTDHHGNAVVGVRLLGSKAQRGVIRFAVKENFDVKTPELFVKTPLPATP